MSMDDECYEIYYFDTWGPTRTIGEEPRGWRQSNYFSCKYTHEECITLIIEDLRQQNYSWPMDVVIKYGIKKIDEPEIIVPITLPN